MTTQTKRAQAERAEAISELRELFPPGSTATTIVRHVARSGMSRRISVLTCAGGQPRNVSHLVARATGGFRLDLDTMALVVPGAGMDMGFHVVYTLSQVLYGEGYGCLGERCPAAVHVNARTAGEREASYGQVHRDGYAVSQRWL